MLMSELEMDEYERLCLLDGLRQDIVRVIIKIVDYNVIAGYEDILSGGESLIDLHDRLSRFLSAR